MAPSKLAYHRRVLREAGLVHEAKRGRWAYYTLDNQAFAGLVRAVEARSGDAAAPPARGVGRRRRGGASR